MAILMLTGHINKNELNWITAITVLPVVAVCSLVIVAY